MAASTQEAFVTLATNDMYALGALVLGHSLRHVGTTKQLAVMITSTVTQGIREQLAAVFDSITVVNVLDSGDAANLSLLQRPDLGVTFTKLHCWRLTQYAKCVFLDADTLALQNVDELFEREEFSAAPDCGWPDCFNSGVFVFRPSNDTYNNLLQFAVTVGSFDGGDQGLLNLYFADWATKDISRHLPFTYNVVSTTFYTYKPSIKHFKKNVKIVHFLGETKPWHHSFNMQSRQVEGVEPHGVEYLQVWWDFFMSKVQPKLDPGMANAEMGVAGELASLHLHQLAADDAYTAEQLADRSRQYAWERGQIDYMGIDSFSLIQQRIDSVLAAPPAPVVPSTQAPPFVSQPAPSAQATPSAPPMQPKSIMKK